MEKTIGIVWSTDGDLQINQMPMSRLSTLVNLRVSRKRLYCCEKFFFFLRGNIVTWLQTVPIALGMFIVQCLKAKFVIYTLPLHCTIIHVTISEAIVSLEHRLRRMKVAPQPEHHLRGEKCERVKKEAPQPRGWCSLQHGAPVEEQTCFLVGNNFLAFPVSLFYIMRS